MGKILAKVLYIFDGDTIEVDTETKGKIKTRARWVDAPETRKSGESPRNEADLNQWEWGARSRSYLETILKDQQLIIVPYDLDQYSRTLADWYVGSVRSSNNVQTKLCEAGMAVDLLPFQRYTLTSKDITTYVAILRKQLNARTKKLGVWGDSNFVMPSQWRETKT